ncbi:hypothetical protein TcasGA2_TC005578 [Tribolium castaneum]|uniref:Uncharacterized protein n=1 Tax=Tribolium castaneum TaxID=7070 RepID=D6WXF1_TRICA|nr:hypothetical protein TcasGA2_TC005578 [Tribolium castaneum]
MLICSSRQRRLLLNTTCKERTQHSKYGQEFTPKMRISCRGDVVFHWIILSKRVQNKPPASRLFMLELPLARVFIYASNGSTCEIGGGTMPAVPEARACFSLISVISGGA